MQTAGNLGPERRVHSTLFPGCSQLHGSEAWMFLYERSLLYSALYKHLKLNVTKQ